MYDVSRKGVLFDVSDGSPKEVRFQSPLPSGCPAVDRAVAYLYESANSRGAVVFVHGMGRKSLSWLRFYPEMLCRQGFTVLMPVLPFHYGRVSKDGEQFKRFLGGPTEVMEKKFYQAVVDVRTCVDFLERSGYERIHIMGISSGGMVAVIAMAVDTRIERCVLVITGGNLEIISWHSIATRIYRTGKSRRAHREQSVRIGRELDECARSFTSLEDLERIPSFFRYDPCLFAKFIDTDRVMMFTALLDPWIPKRSSDDLWRRLGGPVRYMLPSGHLTAHLLFRRLILKRSVDFFRRDNIDDEGSGLWEH
jgi:pimeloyl-ACP methyl ester carboxylesterase